MKRIQVASSNIPILSVKKRFSDMFGCSLMWYLCYKIQNHKIIRQHVYSWILSYLIGRLPYPVRPHWGRPQRSSAHLENRISPFFRQQDFEITSHTYSHKLDPNTNFCGYNLTGKCNDTRCTGESSNVFLYCVRISHCLWSHRQLGKVVT